MNIEQEYRVGVRQYLDKLNKDIEGILTQLINHEYPDEVTCLDFEIFLDSFTRDFPVRVFFMDDDECEFFIEVDGVAQCPSPVDPDLLDIPCVYPYEYQESFTILDDKFNPWSAASNELIEWFSERWNSCGGSNFKRKAYIAPHDRANAFNLVKSEWEKRW